MVRSDHDDPCPRLCSDPSGIRRPDRMQFQLRRRRVEPGSHLCHLAERPGSAGGNHHASAGKLNDIQRLPEIAQSEPARWAARSMTCPAKTIPADPGAKPAAWRAASVQLLQVYRPP